MKIASLIICLLSQYVPAGSVFPVASGGTSFITSVTGGVSMNNFTGYIGGDFSLSSTKTLTAVGRRCVTGNSQTHDLWIVHDDNSGVLAHVTVNMTGCTPGTFVYSSASATLTNGVGYACVSGETNAGDSWIDDTSTVTTTAVGSFSISVGSNTAPPSTPVLNFTNTPNADYVPCNFKYT